MSFEDDGGHEPQGNLAIYAIVGMLAFLLGCLYFYFTNALS
jgi:hypothetical protein